MRVQTRIERRAGVMPTDCSYAPGDVRRYGAIPTDRESIESGGSNTASDNSDTPGGSRPSPKTDSPVSQRKNRGRRE